jgi:hypothetical protein
MAGEVRGSIGSRIVEGIRRRRAAVASARVLSYAALTGFLLAPGLWYGPTVDAAAFVLVGSGIRGGAMPYRDYWDDKPPGLYILNALSQAGLPWLDRWLVCWLVTLALTVVAAVLLESLLQPRAGAATAWGAALVSTFFVACYPTALGGGYAESFALPLVLGALWLLDRSDGRRRDQLLTGLLLSAACLVSLQAIPAAAAIGLAATIGRTVRGSVGRMILVGLAGIVLPALAIAWLVIGGAGSEAYNAVVGYNAAYRLNGQGLFWLRLMLAVIFAAALLPSVVAQVARWLRRVDPIDRVAAACAGWAALSMAFFVYGQRVYMHYLILLAPALIVIGAPAFVRFSGRLRSPQAAPRRVAIVAQGSAVAMLVVAALWGAQWPGTGAAITNQWHTDQTAASAWVKANTPASATLFVWGDATEIYLNTDRKPACPYIYLDAMDTPGYWSQRATDDLLARWQASPPAIIVEAPAAVPMFREAASPADDPRTYDTLGELRTFVRDNYHLAHTDGQADVWLRN